MNQLLKHFSVLFAPLAVVSSRRPRLRHPWPPAREIRGLLDETIGLWSGKMGLDHTRLTFRHGGRDTRLTDVHGHVIREILV